jgi:hypothetical protein
MEKHLLIGAIAEFSHQDIELIPDFDEFIIGVVDIRGNIRTVYDREGIIRHVMANDGMDRFSAIDHVDEWADLCRGKNAPLFLDSLENGLKW